MAKYDYDLLVIGGGAAGLTAAGLGATLGASTLLIEADRLGGDCTWFGCIPSKTLLKAARIAHQLQSAGQYGLTDQLADDWFGGVMQHLRAVRTQVYEEADKPENLIRHGIEVTGGRARFLDDHTVRIVSSDNEERTVTARFFVIATGAKAVVPPIPGIRDVPFLTNETVFELEERPNALAIIGGGPVGTELAQAFQRLGSRVTLVDQADRILNRDEPELARVVQRSLADDGVQFEFGAAVDSVEKSASGVRLNLARQPSRTIEVDRLLLAAGRRPNSESLDLDAAGVATDGGAIIVDDRCRTSRRHIFASGDVTGQYAFTHMSEHMSKVAISNALLKFPIKVDRQNVPWVTYTDPELAHVGRSPGQLEAQNIRYRTYRFPFSKIDRAIAESETRGEIRVYARERDGRVYGADVVGTEAGELIGELSLAISNRISLRRISDTIHAYPTMALGVRRVADQWYVRKRSAKLVRLLQLVFGYRGRIIEYDADEIV